MALFRREDAIVANNNKVNTLWTSFWPLVALFSFVIRCEMKRS